MKIEISHFEYANGAACGSGNPGTLANFNTPNFNTSTLI